MGGIVACHETVGTVQPRYDEEGRCDENGQASAWTMVPQRPFVATVASFVPGDRRSATVGEYQGTLAFEDPSGRRCAWQVTLSFSGEDLLVDLVPKPGNTCSGALP
jgi:hypothetical protein